jgi:glycosyltransferase involved in cell wall biosynthesis
MIRICSSLQKGGHEVTLVGVERKGLLPLKERTFKQVRLKVAQDEGKGFYADYWARLFFYLMRAEADVFCAIDLDTILSVYYASILRRKARVYDAHEIFTELKEVIARPAIHRMWTWIGKHTVPHFPKGYTIGEAYAREFEKNYGVRYAVVRNATVLKPLTLPEKKERYILYQGAVNVGRCFEQLIPAMRDVDARLIVCGAGNYLAEARQLTTELGLEEKVIFKGYVAPEELVNYTLGAWVGITLFEATSLSNRLSLANRFFDYMHSAVPQLCIRYAEYEQINGQYEVCLLLEENPTSEEIARALNRLSTDQPYYERLQKACIEARNQYCWQKEEETLLKVYDAVAEEIASRGGR